MDTNLLAVKAHSHNSLKKLTKEALHIKLGHIGPDTFNNGKKCMICAAIRDNPHRRLSQRDAFVQNKPGYYFNADVLTINVLSRWGNRCVMLVRDKCTGYYCPTIYCELKSDTMSKFCLMVKRMRKDQTFSRIGHPIICHLTLDAVGEW